MADEAAQDVVVMQGPVHDPVVRVPLAGTQNALIVMGEPHQVHSIILVVICVYFPVNNR